jgi:hypothetical protein
MINETRGRNSLRSPLGLKNETRYKSVVVLRQGKDFIVVRDKKSGDWTFVVGGCKLGENSKNCARRELREETRNTIRANHLNHLFHFMSTRRSRSEKAKNNAEGKRVTMRYNVYKSNVNKNIRRIKNNFHRTRPRTNANAETTNINKKSRENLLRRGVMWDFMVNHVLRRIPNTNRTRNRW